MVGHVQRVKAGRPEEDDGILDALAAEARQRLGVFRENAHDAAVGTVEEGRILISERRVGKR